MDGFMIEVEYYEYDCGRPCTVDGCMGHEDRNIIVGISIDGIYFDVDGHYAGDYPSGGYIKPSDVAKAIESLKTALGIKPFVRPVVQELDACEECERPRLHDAIWKGRKLCGQCMAQERRTKE